MNMIWWVVLIFAFLTYSVSLWGTGYFQMRSLNEEQKSIGKFGNERLYLIFVIVTLISLMVYFGANFYISSTSSFRLMQSQPMQPVQYTRAPQYGPQPAPQYGPQPAPQYGPQLAPRYQSSQYSQ